MIPTKWKLAGIALKRGNKWDKRLTGFLAISGVIKRVNKYFMYYGGAAGTRSFDDGPKFRALGLAISKDGIEFKKYKRNPILTYGSEEEEGIFCGIPQIQDNIIYIHYGRIEYTGPGKVDVFTYCCESANGKQLSNHKKVYGSKGNEAWPYASFIDNDDRWHVLVGKRFPLKIISGLTPYNLGLGKDSNLKPNYNDEPVGNSITRIGNKLVCIYDRPIKRKISRLINPTNWKNKASINGPIEGDIGKCIFYDNDLDKWFMYVLNPNGKTIDTWIPS